MSPLVAAQILLTITLAVSGLAKIRDPLATQDAMRSLRMPARTLHPLASRLLAPGELVLAAGAWVPLVPLQVIVAGATLALMTTYLVLILRALRFSEPVSCSCFGNLGSPTVSPATAGRNIVLTLLGLTALASAATGTTAEAVVGHPGSLLAWALVLSVTVALTWLTLGGAFATGVAAANASPARARGETGPHDAPAVGIAEEGDELDYVRNPIPSALVRTLDGDLVPVRCLAQDRAVLLVWVSIGCGPCERVLDARPAWSQRLAPFVDVRTVVHVDPEALSDDDLDRLGPGALQDVAATLAIALEGGGTPSAALLGADGLLAGGPVAGGDAVMAFAGEIIEQIDEARAASEPTES